MSKKPGISRRLSALLLAAVIMLGLAPHALAADGFAAEYLTLQPGSDTLRINLNWYAPGAAAADVTGQVRFTADSGATYITADADETVTATTNKVACKATVVGLEGGTSYAYQVSNDGGTTWSQAYSYATPADGAFTFAFVGDPQLKSGNQDVRALVRIQRVPSPRVLRSSRAGQTRWPHFLRSM